MLNFYENETYNFYIKNICFTVIFRVSCDKRGLNLDYLPSFRSCLTQPLVSQGSEGVPQVIKAMDDYDIVKEDFDNIMEVTKWPKSFDPKAQLDSKAQVLQFYRMAFHLSDMYFNPSSQL